MKVPCTTCGAKILPTTAQATGGVCMACKQGIRKDLESSRAYYAEQRDKIHPFDIRTNAEWKRLGWTAENRPPITVNHSEVPEQFRHLIPYVERWGINCDVTRGDYFDKQPRADIDDFYQAVLPHWEALNAWVDESPQTEAKLNFMLMLKAYSEAVPPPPPEEIAAIHRRWAEEREAKRQYWRQITRKSQNDRND